MKLQSPEYYHETRNLCALYSQTVGKAALSLHHLEEDDTRLACLNNCHASSVAAASILGLLSLNNRSQIATTVGVEDREDIVDRVATSLEMMAKTSLLTDTMFQIENACRNIMLAPSAAGSPPKEKPEKQFSLLGAQILTFSGIDPSKNIAFEVASTLRNSLHNNGVYLKPVNPKTRQNPWSPILAKLKYTFEDGRQIKCGGWPHVIAALSEVVRLFCEITEANPISIIADIKDPFSQQESLAQKSTESAAK